MEVAALIIVHEEDGLTIERAVQSARRHFHRIVVGHTTDRDLGFLRGARLSSQKLSNKSLSRNRWEMVKALGPGRWAMFLDGDDVFLPTVSAFIGMAAVHVASGQGKDTGGFWGDTYQVNRSDRPWDAMAPFWSMPGSDWPGWAPWHGQFAQVQPSEVMSASIAGAGSILFHTDAWLEMGFVGDWWAGEDYLYQCGLAATSKQVVLRVPTVMYRGPEGGHMSESWEGPDPIAATMKWLKKHGADPEHAYDASWRPVPIKEWLQTQDALRKEKNQ